VPKKMPEKVSEKQNTFSGFSLQITNNVAKVMNTLFAWSGFSPKLKVDFFAS